MSVIGIDIGTTSSVVAVIRAGGIDIVVNEVSNRRTPSVVGFTDKLRTIGESGFTGRQRNTKNTVSGIKRLLGRKFKDEALQKEISRMGGCNWVELEDGSVGAEVSLRNKKQIFSTQQLAAMLISHLKTTCEGYTKTKASNAVLSVPGYYSDSQRRALFDAAKIAGITCLQVINDLSAVALLYGFYRENEKIDSKVMFVDIGSSDLSVAIAHFTPGQCQILSYQYDANLGGYDIDNILADYFAARFQDKHKFNIKSNARAWQRLMDAVERTKKTLNENEQASINIECIHEEKDLNDKISRTDYLSLLNSSGLLERVSIPIKKALEESGLTASQLESVEWVGSAMRAIPFQEGVSKAVGRNLSSTMNAEESVAKGCSLACALVSPLIKLGKRYKLVDIQPTPVTLSWKDLNENTPETSIELFSKKQHFGKTKYVTITRKDAKPFDFQIRYTHSSEIQLQDISNGVIAAAKVPTITKQPDENGNRDAEIRLKIRIDPSGTTHVTEVELVEKKEVEVEVPITPAPATPAPATPATPATPAPAQQNTEQPATENKESEVKDTEMKDAATPAEPPKPTTKIEKQMKTFYTKIPYEVTYKELPNSEIDKSLKSLEVLTKDDKYVLDSLNAKNFLESSALRARDQFNENWKGFATEAEENKIKELCNEIEDWLYNEGSDEVKETYEEKLKELTKLTDPLTKRAYEWANVPAALAGLQNTLAFLKNEVNNGGDKYSHIEKEELEKVLKKVEEAENWLNPLLAAHQKVTQTSEPVLSSSDLNQRNQNVTKFCQTILSKPKPAPPKETPAPAPANPASATPEGNAAPEAQNTKTETPASGEQKTDKMDTVDS